MPKKEKDDDLKSILRNVFFWGFQTIFAGIGTCACVVLWWLFQEVYAMRIQAASMLSTVASNQERLERVAVFGTATREITSDLSARVKALEEAKAKRGGAVDRRMACVLARARKWPYHKGSKGESCGT
jgi:hypothetical protein